MKLQTTALLVQRVLSHTQRVQPPGGYELISASLTNKWHFHACVCLCACAYVYGIPLETPESTVTIGKVPVSVQLARQDCSARHKLVTHTHTHSHKRTHTQRRDNATLLKEYIPLQCLEVCSLIFKSDQLYRTLTTKVRQRFHTISHIQSNVENMLAAEMEILCQNMIIQVGHLEENRIILYCLSLSRKRKMELTNKWHSCYDKSVVITPSSFCS